MEMYLRITAGLLIAAILCVVLSKSGSEISLLLTICVCAMTVLAAAEYFRPVLLFAHKLIAMGNLNDEMLTVLLKVVGIGLLSQIVGLICADAGNQSLAKALQIITTALILCICIPLLEQMLSLMEMMLGGI